MSTSYKLDHIGREYSEAGFRKRAFSNTDAHTCSLGPKRSFNFISAKLAGITQAQPEILVGLCINSRIKNARQRVN